MFGILDRKKDLIGVCGLTYMDWKNRNAEISIYLAGEKWQQRKETKYSRNLLTSYAFGELGLHKVYTEIYSFVEETIHLYKSLNFHNDGSIRDTVWRNGRWWSSEIYSKLESEFKHEKNDQAFDLTIGVEEEGVIKKVLKSKFWASGAGVEKVLEFENKFKKYIKTDYCVTVSNGTAALHLALSLFDIRNKEVILPSLSFVSTAHAILYNGGIPVFVDVEPDTMCIDSNLIKKSITKKTKVILPVHFGGMPCKLDDISDLCKENNISLVEDAAHAAG